MWLSRAANVGAYGDPVTACRQYAVVLLLLILLGGHRAVGKLEQVPRQNGWLAILAPSPAARGRRFRPGSWGPAAAADSR
jgi:hypothetical protein